MSIDALNTLRARFRGHILQAGDSGYDEARKVYNGMIDRRPRIIARCVDAADVMAAVDYGRDNKLLTAVRGGGHNGGGLGVCDDGLVIDATRGGNSARWINHSCAPNCEIEEEHHRIFIEARRDIRPGEELAYDYNLQIGERHTAKAKREHACLCGARRCRGTMLGEEEG